MSHQNTDLTARLGRPRRLAGLCAGVFLCGAASSQEPVAPPIDVTTARAAFEQARGIAAADAGELWGVSLDFPLLFVDPVSRACVADREDTEGLLEENDGVWVGRFPADRGVANFATEWAGRRWTMLVWPLPRDEGERARLLMHESFHNAQEELELSVAGGSGSCAHLETFDGRVWLRLEARALAAALRAEEAERERAAADALLFRAMRRALFPGAGEAEDALERIEGSAEYTGVRLGCADERERLAVAAAALDGLPGRPSLTRSFQYVTGPALGLLLDGYDPFWREAFLAGSTFPDLLAPAVWFEAPEALEAEALERASGYGFEEVVAEETERERERQERLAGYRRRFLEGPVLVLPARSAQRSFDPNRIENLEGVGSVYGVLWVSDEWGVADAPGGGLILLDGTVRLAGPADVEGPHLGGEGWTLDLDPGWTVVPGERDGDFRVVENGE